MCQIGRAFAVLRHSNGRVNRQLKRIRTLALRSCANGRGKPTAKASLGFSAVQPCKRTREPTAKTNSGFIVAQLSGRTDNGTDRIVKTGWS